MFLISTLEKLPFLWCRRNSIRNLLDRSFGGPKTSIDRITTVESFLSNFTTRQFILDFTVLTKLSDFYLTMKMCLFEPALLNSVCIILQVFSFQIYTGLI